MLESVLSWESRQVIRKLHVEHYRSLGDLTVEFGAQTTLVGANGSGKSNVVDCLRFLKDAVTDGLDRAVSERQGIDSIRQWSASKPYNMTIAVEVTSSLGTGAFSLTLGATKGGAFSIVNEAGSWVHALSTENRPTPQIAYQRDDAGNVHLLVPGTPTLQLPHLKREDELFLGSLHAQDFQSLALALSSFEAYTIFPNVLRSPQKASNATTLSSTGDNLTSVFRSLTRRKARDAQTARREIIEAMRLVMPALENIHIQSLGGLMVPVFRVKEADGRSHDFNVSQVSDGTLRVLGLLTALYQPQIPMTIALEEPELTVNPGILAMLADSMAECSERAQLIVTTHSPDLLDKIGNPELIRAVQMVDGVTQLSSIAAHQKAAVRDQLFTLGELMSIEGLHA